MKLSAANWFSKTGKKQDFTLSKNYPVQLWREVALSSLQCILSEQFESGLILKALFFNNGPHLYIFKPL